MVAQRAAKPAVAGFDMAGKPARYENFHFTVHMGASDFIIPLCFVKRVRFKERLPLPMTAGAALPHSIPDHLTRIRTSPRMTSQADQRERFRRGMRAPTSLNELPENRIDNMRWRDLQYCGRGPTAKE